MFDELSLEAFRALAKDNKNIVVYKEFAADQLTPTLIYAAIEATAKDITLLESNPNEKEQGRFSHLCFDPIVTISADGAIVTVKSDNDEFKINSNPFVILREYYNKLRCTGRNSLCKFAGGFVGFMAYDAIRYIEDIAVESRAGIPAILFRYYKNHISFDHQTGKLMLATVVQLTGDDDLSSKYSVAKAELEKNIAQLEKYQPSSYFNNNFVSNIADGRVHCEVDDREYLALVAKAKQHIVAGDIFQVVLSREFSIKINAKPFDIYRALSFSNPSPHMFYFTIGDIAIAGASPEKLVSLQNGILEVRPLAGTRARGEKSDVQLQQELLNDEKEMAEHMMLVDLGRNDIGKVAVPGTVKVTKLAEIELYSRVMHISSTIQGKLSSDQDAFAVLQATFPAGTLSGAPKVRAMEIIASLEVSPRGLYGGVVCGIDGAGNIDSAIAIRMATIKDNVATVRAGAGVVYDSNPQAEADETSCKARAILEGIALAEEMRS
jgi:anthranilate synthase component 1